LGVQESIENAGMRDSFGIVQLLLNFNGGDTIKRRVTGGETRRMPSNSQRKRSHTQVRGKNLFTNNHRLSLKQLHGALPLLNSVF